MVENTKPKVKEKEENNKCKYIILQKMSEQNDIVEFSDIEKYEKDGYELMKIKSAPRSTGQSFDKSIHFAHMKKK